MRCFLQFDNIKVINNTIDIVNHHKIVDKQYIHLNKIV